MVKTSGGAVAIGGVGGSGTRVVAAMLMQAGFYMGSNLNRANDNLWFTLLFKRPAWFFEEDACGGEGVARGLSAFEKVMTGKGSLSTGEVFFIMRAAAGMAVTGHDYTHAGRGLWPFKTAVSMINSRGADGGDYIGWGWKEPNTHIYVEHLAKKFEDIRYIHVIRNGLDMAFSANQAQLFNWGSAFGVDTGGGVPLAAASLKYWIAANRKAIERGAALLKERFLLINFEKLCAEPENEAKRLLDFLGIEDGGKKLAELKAIPSVPASSGRHKERDMSVFSPEDIRAVRELGFDA